MTRQKVRKRAAPKLCPTIRLVGSPDDRSNLRDFVARRVNLERVTLASRLLRKDYEDFLQQRPDVTQDGYFVHRCLPSCARRMLAIGKNENVTDTYRDPKNIPSIPSVEACMKRIDVPHDQWWLGEYWKQEPVVNQALSEWCADARCALGEEMSIVASCPRIGSLDNLIEDLDRDRLVIVQSDSSDWPHAEIIKHVRESDRHAMNRISDEAAVSLAAAVEDVRLTRWLTSPIWERLSVAQRWADASRDSMLKSAVNSTKKMFAVSTRVSGPVSRRLLEKLRQHGIRPGKNGDALMIEFYAELLGVSPQVALETGGDFELAFMARPENEGVHTDAVRLLAFEAERRKDDAGRKEAN
jgi:hypothetical protein